MRIKGTREDIIPGSRWLFLELETVQGGERIQDREYIIDHLNDRNTVMFGRSPEISGHSHGINTFLDYWIPVRDPSLTRNVSLKSALAQVHAIRQGTTDLQAMLVELDI